VYGGCYKRNRKPGPWALGLVVIYFRNLGLLKRAHAGLVGEPPHTTPNTATLAQSLPPTGSACVSARPSPIFRRQRGLDQAQISSPWRVAGELGTALNLRHCCPHCRHAFKYLTPPDGLLLRSSPSLLPVFLPAGSGGRHTINRCSGRSGFVTCFLVLIREIDSEQRLPRLQETSLLSHIPLHSSSRPSNSETLYLGANPPR
jgi:hypothetical protein